MAVQWEVIEQHLDEAAFQVEALERGLDGAAPSLSVLQRGPERRLLAHVDALVVGGRAIAEELLLPVAKGRIACDAAGHTAVAMALVGLSRLDAWAWMASQPSAALRDAAVQGAVWAATPSSDAWVLRQLDAAGPAGPGAGLLAYAGRRRLRLPAVAGHWLRHLDPAVAATVWQALAGRLDPAMLREHEGVVLMQEDRAAQHAALLPLLAAGSRRAWALCEELTLTPEPSLDAAQLYAALGGPEQHRRLAAHLPPRGHSVALRALADSGNAALVPRLLHCLQAGDPVAQRLAGEAIAAITGMPLDDGDAGLLAARPQRTAPIDGALPPVEEDPEALAALPPLDEDTQDAAAVAQAPAGALLPDAVAVAAWWQAAAAAYRLDTRYLGGAPFSSRVARAALVHGPMRSRHVLARSLLVRSRGRLHLDTRALPGHQLAALGLPAPRSPLRGPVQGW
jgi:uncharacterized protein (TIGR02270 family)